MRALPADVTERFRIETVDLDPEHVEVGDGAQDLQIALGLGVEVAIKQDVDVGACPVADRLQMHAQVAQDFAIDVDLGGEGRAETRSPTGWLALVVREDVGLERGELLLAHLASDCLDAVEVLDRRLVPGGVIDPPRCAMRPIDPDTVADLATEQFVAGHTETFRLGIEQRILDRAERLRHHAAGGRAGGREQLGVDALVPENVLPDDAGRQALDRSTDAGRAEALVELAPADDAVLGRQLDEVVVSPAGVAGENFETCCFRRLGHVAPCCPAGLFSLAGATPAPATIVRLTALRSEAWRGVQGSPFRTFYWKTR